MPPTDHELDSRLARLEAAFATMSRLENLPDDIAKLSNMLARFDERHESLQSAVSRAFSTIETVQASLERDRVAFSEHSKFNEQRFLDMDRRVTESQIQQDRISRERVEVLDERVDDLSREVHGKVQWARGAWVAASVLWIAIQGMVIYWVAGKDEAMRQLVAHSVEVHRKLDTLTERVNNAHRQQGLPVHTTGGTNGADR
jgi:glycine cleavage system regulatory protein